MKTLEQIEKMNYLGYSTNIWYERNEFWEDEDGTCYNVVRDELTGKLIMICTVDYDDKDLIPIDILFQA